MHTPTKPRWAAVGFSVGMTLIAYGCAVAATLALVGGAGWLSSVTVGVLVGVLMCVVLVLRIRRRSLVLTETGGTVQRDGYRVYFEWTDAHAVETRRLGGLFPVDVILFRKSEAEPIDSKGRTRAAVPAKVYKVGADRRLQISVYDAAWREGPAGSALVLEGIALGSS